MGTDDLTEGKHEKEDGKGAYQTAHNDAISPSSPAYQGDDAIETGDLGCCAGHSGRDAFEGCALVGEFGACCVGLSVFVSDVEGDEKAERR